MAANVADHVALQLGISPNKQANSGVIILPAGFLNAVNTGPAGRAAFFPAVMVSAPDAVPGQRHYRGIQGVEKIP